MPGTKKPTGKTPGAGQEGVKAHVEFSTDRLDACQEHLKSNAVLRQIELIKKSMDKLTGDRSDLKEVDSMLKKALEDVEGDIKMVNRMCGFAFKAMLFQRGILTPEEDPEVAAAVPGQGCSGSAGAKGGKSAKRSK